MSGFFAHEKECLGSDPNGTTLSGNVRTIMAQKVCRSRENGNLYGASSCVNHPMDSRRHGNDKRRELFRARLSDELHPVVLQAHQPDVILIDLMCGQRRQKSGLRKLPTGDEFDQHRLG